MYQARLFSILIAITFFAVPGFSEERSALRRPIAVHTLDAERVVVGNRNGSIAIVNFEAGRVAHEQAIAQQLSDLTPLSQSNEAALFLATDDAAHQVLLVEVKDESTRPVTRAPVAPYPVCSRATSDAQRVAVASLWSRQLTILRIIRQANTNVTLETERVVDLPFAPRQQIILPGDKQVMVFDSFGGRLAVVELDSGKFVLEREFPGHAVRGLVFSPDRQMLLASHQMLNPDAHVNQSDIHWGLLMSNDLRWMRLDSLLNAEREIYAGGRVHPLGVPGRGGGDPAGVTMTREGTVVVCLGGVNQVMIGTQDDLSLRPVKVGRRPTTVALSHDDRQAIVANTFDDSLSIVDLAEKKVVSTISLGPTRERTLIEKGEELFYDARFSHEGWMSCHSCHTDGHSNFTRNDNLSDGGFGAPKLVLSLLGRKDTKPFAWNASVSSLPEQVRNSIHKTMQSDYESVPDEQVAALTAYIESLPSPPSVDVLRGRADHQAIERGRELFVKNGCIKCHAPPAYTVETLEQVGLKDEIGTMRFNPPSLRGVGQRDALLHDGRAKSLDEVFRKQGHPHGQAWSDDDVRDLVTFLRSL